MRYKMMKFVISTEAIKREKNMTKAGVHNKLAAPPWETTNTKLLSRKRLQKVFS